MKPGVHEEAVDVDPFCRGTIQLLRIRRVLPMGNQMLGFVFRVWGF